MYYYDLYRRLDIEVRRRPRKPTLEKIAHHMYIVYAQARAVQTSQKTSLGEWQR